MAMYSAKLPAPNALDARQKPRLDQRFFRVIKRQARCLVHDLADAFELTVAETDVRHANPS
jgi:hypothetical protein